MNGTGKEIKIDPETIRARRVNSCLNKTLVVYFKNSTIKNFKRVQHWQQILFKFYGITNEDTITRK